jgi:aryl-alcohol dehydrogenase-like predicted oxidoreductase
MQAVDEIKALAADSGLSCAQLCVGVLLATDGLTGSIVGARNARQGSLIANLGVTITNEQRDAVRAAIGRLQKDLEGL